MAHRLSGVEIRMFAGSFAPNYWALCDAQLLSIAQNPALFSILGTTYGGDGQTSFALPDLRGLVPMHAGQAPGRPGHHLGERGGNQIVVNFIICVTGIFPSRG